MVTKSTFLYFQKQALQYLQEDPDLCNQLYNLKPTSEQFLDMLWELCDDDGIGQTDDYCDNWAIDDYYRTVSSYINESALTKPSFESAINETFFASPPVSI